MNLRRFLKRIKAGSGDLKVDYKMLNHTINAVLTKDHILY